MDENNTVRRNRKILLEFEKILESHLSNKTYPYDVIKDEIILLLKEYARRMLIWEKRLKMDGCEISGYFPMYNIAFILKGVRFELPQMYIFINNKLRGLEYADKYILNAYFAWKYCIDDSIKRQYGLPNPYTPYIEIFKIGGKNLITKYDIFEVLHDSWIGIRQSPLKQYFTETPFWDKDL